MTENGDDRVLSGIRVFELSIAVAGPSCGRYLAYHGADVLRIETRTNPDIVRLIGSAWAREDPEYQAFFGETSPYISEMNADKRSVGLNLKEPAAKEVAEKLIAKCDVFLTNYTAPAVKALGMTYEDVKAIKPDIVYLAMPGFGSNPDGPYYPYLAWGPNQAPLVGLDDFTGHADSEPAGIATIAPPDYCSGLHGTVAVLAGLEHRDRTGEGVNLDMSQFEGTVSLLGPFVMDHALRGETHSRMGNRSLWSAPEGIYPCAGEERWVAISVTSDEEWRALGRVAGSPEWAGEERYASVEGRLEHHDELDDAIASWTSQHSPLEVTAWLQEAGVAASTVATNEDVLADPQVLDRQWFAARPSARFSRDLFNGSVARLGETPGRNDRAGPAMCEHTVEVLTELAGLSETEVDQLAADGAVFTMDQPDRVIDRPYHEYLHVFLPYEPDARDL